MPKAAERQPPLLYCVRHKNSFASQSEDQPAPCVLRGINKTGVLSMTCRYSSTMPSKGMAELPHTGLSPTWCFAIPLLRVHTSKDFDVWLMRKKLLRKHIAPFMGPSRRSFLPIGTGASVANSLFRFRALFAVNSGPYSRKIYKRILTDRHLCSHTWCGEVRNIKAQNDRENSDAFSTYGLRMKITSFTLPEKTQDSTRDLLAFGASATR